jgi:hypothetical protein
MSSTSVNTNYPFGEVPPSTATYDNFERPGDKPGPNRHERRKQAAIRKTKKYKDFVNKSKEDFLKRKKRESSNNS